MTESWFDRHGLPSRPELGERIRELVQLAGEGQSPNAKLYEHMLRTLVHFMGQAPDRWDAKILDRTLQEMTSAFSRLQPYRRRRKVTVFGSARTPVSDPDYALARHLGELLVRDDFMVITGAGPGIMQAAHEGAGREDSIGLNITLPREQSANPVIEGDDKLIDFRFFFTRKLFFVKEADAFVLCPGGLGTQDEAFELLTLVQTGKSPVMPIVLLDAPETGYWAGWLEYVREHLVEPGRISPSDLALVRHVHTAEEALAEVRGFYDNYHSAREIDGRLHLRLSRAPDTATLARWSESFRDLCGEDGISLCSAHPVEAEESELQALPRLAFRFAARQFGRLRQLIDAINSLP